MQVCDQLLPTVKQRAWHDLRKREAHATTRWWWPGRTLGIWDLCRIHGRSKMSQSGQGSEWKFKCPEFQRPEGLKSRSPEFQMSRSPIVQKFGRPEIQMATSPKTRNSKARSCPEVRKASPKTRSPSQKATSPEVWMAKNPDDQKSEY